MGQVTQARIPGPESNRRCDQGPRYRTPWRILEQVQCRMSKGPNILCEELPNQLDQPECWRRVYCRDQQTLGPDEAEQKGEWD